MSYIKGPSRLESGGSGSPVRQPAKADNRQTPQSSRPRSGGERAGTPATFDVDRAERCTRCPISAHNVRYICAETSVPLVSDTPEAPGTKATPPIETVLTPRS